MRTSHSIQKFLLFGIIRLLWSYYSRSCTCHIYTKRYSKSNRKQVMKRISAFLSVNIMCVKEQKDAKWINGNGSFYFCFSSCLSFVSLSFIRTQRNGEWQKKNDTFPIWKRIIKSTGRNHLQILLCSINPLCIYFDCCVRISFRWSSIALTLKNVVNTDESH